MQIQTWYSNSLNSKFRNIVAFDDTRLIYLEWSIQDEGSAQDRSFQAFKRKISHATDTDHFMLVARESKVGVLSMLVSEITAIEDGELIGENKLVFRGSSQRISLRHPPPNDRRILLERFADLDHGPTVTQISVLSALKGPLVMALVGVVGIVCGLVMITTGRDLPLWQQIAMSYQSGGRLFLTVLLLPIGALGVLGSLGWAARRVVHRPTIRLYQKRLAT